MTAPPTPSPAPAPAPPAPAPPAIERLPFDDVVVLVVDDDSTTCKLLSRIVTQMGGAVVQASEGSEGLRLAHERLPDVVVTDINMRPVDGIAMLAGIRHSLNPQVVELPVLVFTGEKSQDTVEIARKLGVSGYLVKPFNPHGFARQVLEIVTKRRALG